MISKINLVTVYYIYTIYMSRIYVCVYINICNYCVRMYNIYIYTCKSHIYIYICTENVHVNNIFIHVDNIYGNAVLIYVIR